EVGARAEGSFAEVGVRAEGGFAEVGVRAEGGTSEVGARAEGGSSEGGVRAEGGSDEVGVRAKSNICKSNALWKPDASKIVVSRLNLFIESYPKSIHLLFARIVQHADLPALVFLVESLARAGRAHMFFAVADE